MGVARTGKRERLDEQFMNLGEAERLPGKSLLENIDGPWREEDYRRGCRWAGDEKRGHCGQAARVSEKQARVDDCNDDGKAM